MKAYWRPIFDIFLNEILTGNDLPEKINISRVWKKICWKVLVTWIGIESEMNYDFVIREWVIITKNRRVLYEMDKTGYVVDNDSRISNSVLFGRKRE